MPPRDDRDFEDKRQQILDGALQVFASKGFEKATNKEIAAASGIGSPGLIYHYFKDKNDLLQQVLEQRLPLVQLLSHSEELKTKPIQDVLTLFGHAFLRIAENPTLLALFKLVMGEAIRQPHVAEIVNKIGPSRSVAFLTEYLEQQMAAGVLEPMNPSAAVRCFTGSFIAYLLTREVFMQPDVQQLSAEVMVETAVKVFLQGMLRDV